jgi:lipopolysaccharide/colanic/teichoic acid biosynthesis glycosyltransferase
MLQNIGQVVSKETSGLIEEASAITGATHRVDDADSPLWHAAIDHRASFVARNSASPLRLVMTVPALGEHELLRSGPQNRLPYSWKDDCPVTPAPSASRQFSFAIKRSMDLILAFFLILMFSPVFVVAALSIKITSKGPILFRQQRVGFMNREFNVYKFRTMHVGSQDSTGVTQTTADDARITRVGKILRKTSVDELPQIINILKGEMSFVGPRPHVAGMLAGGLRYEELVPYYNLRHAMKPGLTGWAQANGLRGPTVDPVRARQRVDHDIAYIQNFSLGLDVVILMRTAWREFVTGTGV